MEEIKNTEISLVKKKHYWAKNGSLRSKLNGFRRKFYDFEIPHKRACHKEKIEASKEGGQHK